MATTYTRPKDKTQITSITDSEDGFLVDGTTGFRFIKRDSLLSWLAGVLVGAPTTYKLAPLDGTNKISLDYLPASISGGMNFKGSLAGASVPATSTAAGDAYVISSAGVSQGKTWAVNDVAVYNGTSGSWTQIVASINAVASGGTGASTAGGARTNLDVLWADDARGMAANRTPRGGLWFDGSASYKLTGTAGLNFGLNDFSFSAVIRFGDYTPSTTAILFATHSTGNNRVQFDLHTTGAFRVTFTDSGGAVTVYTIPPDVALIDGETYSVTITLDRDGSAILYINGISDRDKSGSGVSVSIAASSAVDVGLANAGVYGIGYAVDGVIYATRVYNRLLTASDALAIAKVGHVDAGDQWGTAVGGTYTSDFSAGANGVVANTGTASVTGNIDSVSDGSTSKDDVLEIVFDTTVGAHLASRTSTLTVGKRYKIAFEYYIPAGQAFSKIRLGPSTGSAASYVEGGTSGSWATGTGEVLATGTNIHITGVTSGNAVAWAGVAGEKFYLKNVVVTQLGCVLNPDLCNADPAQSLNVWDRSSNLNHGTAAASGVAQVVKDGQVNAAELTVGSSTRLKKLITATAALNYGSIAAASSADLTITVTGAAVNDSVALGLPSSPTAGIIFNAFVSATNTVTVRAFNITAGAIDPASLTFRATVFSF